MEIGGKKIVSSGSFVVAHGQSLMFHPVPHDKNFKLSVDVKLKNDPAPNNISLVADGSPGAAQVQVTGGYRNGVHVTHHDPMKFASNLDKIYYGNFSVMCAGPYESFTSIFTYTVLEAERR